MNQPAYSSNCNCGSAEEKMFQPGRGFCGDGSSVHTHFDFMPGISGWLGRIQLLLVQNEKFFQRITHGGYVFVCKSPPAFFARGCIVIWKFLPKCAAALRSRGDCNLQ